MGAGGADDGADRRVDLPGVGIDEFAHRRITFGDECAVVEQPRGGQERGGVDRHDGHAPPAQRVDGPRERRPPDLVEFGQRVEYRHDRVRRRGQPRVGRPRPPSGPGRQYPHRAVGRRRIGGEDRDAVVGPARRDHSVGAHHADGRFDADQPLERGGHPARTGGVGTDREIGLPARHGHRRAGTRTAGDEFGTARVRYRAVGRPGADQPGRELVQVGLADHHGARRAQSGDGGGVGVGQVGVGRAPGGGRQPRHVHIVLDRQPQPGQRSGRGGALGRHLGVGAAVDPHGHCWSPVNSPDECHERRSAAKAFAWFARNSAMDSAFSARNRR